jgi:lipopolysaccharide/colanic/teichoic acid biosynthesis glycosyltransferase
MHPRFSQAVKEKPAFFTKLGGRESELDRRYDSLLTEKEFVRALRLERRRSERSGRPFLMMLLEAGGMLRTDGAGSVREILATSLLAHTRDTDVVGWYQDGAVLGVLYTEICETPAKAESTLRQKISTVLSQRLTPKQAENIRISIYIYPLDGEEPGEPNDLTLYPDLKEHINRRKVAHGVKRAVDIVGSLMALILLSPILLGIALAIKLNSRGPVFFRQERLGQYARTFTFLKFRSMYVNSDPKIHQEYVTSFIAGTGKKNADAKGKKVFKITNDPRVTAVGRLLRRASLDELPQLFNVLTGSMSLVGPRPPLPYEVVNYDLWHRRRLFEAKPGITGLWQVNGRSRLTFDDMVRLDLKYGKQSSLLLDLEILMRTPLAVLSGDGAY